MLLEMSLIFPWTLPQHFSEKWLCSLFHHANWNELLYQAEKAFSFKLDFADNSGLPAIGLQKQNNTSELSS